MIIPQNIKAVIFDVDGLMIDSEPSWKKTHDEFLKKNNIFIDEKSRANLRGTGLKQLIIELRYKFHLEKSVDDLLYEYREEFYKNFYATKAAGMIEGVEEVIKYFYEKDFQLGIATGGHTGESMRQMLEYLNLLRYFEVIVSGDEVEKGKPYPDTFFLAAKKLGRLPEECLVLEDSANGVKAGKAAGMTVIGVNKDSKYFNELKEAGADEVFYNLKELL